MEMDDLEPVGDAESLCLDAEDSCWEAAFFDECERRVPELCDLPGLIDADDHEREFHRWCQWLEELDDLDADGIERDLEECAEHLEEVWRAGWLEDENGGAVFVPRC